MKINSKLDFDHCSCGGRLMIVSEELLIDEPGVGDSWPYKEWKVIGRCGKCKSLYEWKQIYSWGDTMLTKPERVK